MFRGNLRSEYEPTPERKEEAPTVRTVTFTEKKFPCTPDMEVPITVTLGDFRTFPKGLSFGKEGVNIFVYPDLNHRPRPRFAIVKTKQNEKGIMVDSYKNKPFRIEDIISITFYSSKDAFPEVEYTDFVVT